MALSLPARETFTVGGTKACRQCCSRRVPSRAVQSRSELRWRAIADGEPRKHAMSPKRSSRLPREPGSRPHSSRGRCPRAVYGRREGEGRGGGTVYTFESRRVRATAGVAKIELKERSRPEWPTPLPEVWSRWTDRRSFDFTSRGLNSIAVR